MHQSQPIRIETADYASFVTCRTIQSRLWLVNNPLLQKRILASLAKYQNTHTVTLYAFVLQGNHYHECAQFPLLNRSGFYRDFNATTAKAVNFFVSDRCGGPVFERRYSEQAVPKTKEDILERIFYCALQPVLAGLCERVEDYPAYNSFFDLIDGKAREFQWTDWRKYNAAKRWKKNAKVEDYTITATLKFSRPPGFEDMSQEEFKQLMLAELERRRLAIIAQRKQESKGFLGKKALLRTKPGSFPINTKKSKQFSRRPLILTVCEIARKTFHDFYFSIFRRYKKASREYLSGDHSAIFPPGTYKPPLFLVPMYS